MSLKDRTRETIERTCDNPVISACLSEEPTEILLGKDDGFGRMDWFRKVPDLVRKRRSGAPVNSIVYMSAELVLVWFKRYTVQSVDRQLFVDRQQFMHTILDDLATWTEKHFDRINPLAQAILRESMDSLFRTERLGL